MENPDLVLQEDRHIHALTMSHPGIHCVETQSLVKIWPGKDFKGHGHYGKVRCEIKFTLWPCTPTPSNQFPNQVSTSYAVQFPRYNPDNILTVKVTTKRSKVNSRSHHDIAHLHSLTNVHTNINFLHLTVSDIWSKQFFFQSYSKVKGEIMVTL